MTKATFDLGKVGAPSLVMSQPNRLSLLLSPSARETNASLISQKVACTPSNLRGQQVDNDQNPDERKIFENRSELKILISQVAMHISANQRHDFFKQIDDLLDQDEWMEEDSLINKSSFFSFLRFITYSINVKRPSLTVASSGNVGASWFHNRRRLSIEFMNDDTVRMVLSQAPDDKNEGEVFVYQGKTPRLNEVLQPFDARDWYLDGQA